MGVRVNEARIRKMKTRWGDLQSPRPPNLAESRAGKETGILP